MPFLYCTKCWRLHCSVQCVLATQMNLTTACSVLINGGGCSSDSSSRHDRASRFPGRRCPRVEQFTVVCHIIVVTVHFQTTFEDVLVCVLVLMALLLFLSLSTEHVVFLCRPMLRVFAVFGLNATLILSLTIIIIIIIIISQLRDSSITVICLVTVLGLHVTIE